VIGDVHKRSYLTRSFLHTIQAKELRNADKRTKDPISVYKSCSEVPKSIKSFNSLTSWAFLIGAPAAPFISSILLMSYLPAASSRKPDVGFRSRASLDRPSFSLRKVHLCQAVLVSAKHALHRYLSVYFHLKVATRKHLRQ
jgi:hypothetical protein